MNVLTVGPSPYLHTKNSRIHASVLNTLSKSQQQKINISSAVWHHDEGFFLPNEEGEHEYCPDDSEDCESVLYPFTLESEQKEAVLYELMKKLQPDVVISIGDYKDTSFIYSIKSLLPHLFKWISIASVDSSPISNVYSHALEYADCIISLNNFSYNNIKNICNNRIERVLYGPKKTFTCDKAEKDNDIIKYISCSKNAQPSNLGAYIKSVSELGKTYGGDVFQSYLHTNLYDPGDYDLEVLIERYNAQNILNMPQEYVSVKDGVSDEEMAIKYADKHAYVDCSVKSGVALSMLEAMRFGCIPIGINAYALSEIIHKMPDEFRFFIPSVLYVGQNEEEYFVADPIGMQKTMEDFLFLCTNKEKLAEAQKSAIEISLQYSAESFQNKFNKIFWEVYEQKTPIPIESF
mgnify:CR=1 FL=1